MGKEIYFLINSLDVGRGGLTKACIQQANMSAELGYKTTILTFNYNSDYDIITEKLFQYYSINRDVEIRNMYDFYRDEKNVEEDLTKVNDCISSDFAYEKVKNKNGYRIYENGLYRYYMTHRDDETVKGVDCFNDFRYRIRSEAYTPKGYLGKVSYMDFELNKPRQMVFKDSKGNCYLSKWVNPETGNAHKVLLFNGNEIKKTFKSDEALKAYFIEKVVENDEYPILISDARNTDDVMTLVDDEKAKKLIRLHSNHVKEPFDVEKSEIVSTVKFALNNLDKIDYLVALTERQKEDIVTRKNHDEKLLALPHGIEVKNSDAHNNFKKDKAVVISRLVSLKQIHHVVEAASLLVEYNPNFLIEIYGSGDQEKKLKDLIKSKGLTENVILKGYTDNIENVYKEAAFSIVTSKTEGFSLSILESMANGVPVLSYNFNYGPEDIITNGKDGLIIEKNNIKQLAENMNYLFSNPKLINEMRINAAKSIKDRFSRDKVKQYWEELFKSL